MFQRSQVLPKIFVLLALIGQLSGLDNYGNKIIEKLSQEGPTLKQKFTFDDLGYLKDETLQGVLVNREYSINWPNAWVPQAGNSLRIEFSHSLSLEDYSSMAVDWNGVRLTSVLFTPENAEHGALEVAIPEDQIQIGYNQLKLELYMGIYDDPCEDPNNPATWATIHKSSFFDFSFELAVPEPDISLYPLPIIDNSSWIDSQITFVIPDNPNTVELNALTMISAKLGQLAAWRTLNFEVFYESWLDELELIEGNIIYIGRADQLQVLRDIDIPITNVIDNSINFFDLDGNPIDTDAGIIWEQASRFDQYAVEIFVTGQSDEGIILAARGLASEDVFPRIQGQLGVIYEVPEPITSPGAPRQIISLQELGYIDQTARGTFNQTINYILPLTMNWQVLTEATLELHFAHSELLHPDRSSLTVLVNNSPIGSVLLDEENAEDGYATFRIPARLFNIGENQLTIITNIKMLDEFIDPYNCTEDYYHEAWVVVYADSFITLPSGPTSITLDLADYPFAFIGSSNLSDTTFIVPDVSNQSIAVSIANVAGRLGRYAEGSHIYPKLINASALVVAEEQAPYQFIFGQPSENEAIYELNEILPLPFIRGTNEAQRIDQIANILPPNGTVGYLEAALTTENQPRLVITGDGLESLKWAAAGLSDPNQLKELKGDLVIFDAPASIYATYVKQLTTPPLDSPFPEVESTPDVLSPNWMIWISVGIFLVTLFILIAVAWSIYSRSH